MLPSWFPFSQIQLNLFCAGLHCLDQGCHDFLSGFHFGHQIFMDSFYFGSVDFHLGDESTYL
jgi:hypothetical protein